MPAFLGFNDETARYLRVIPGLKKLLLALETGHNIIPEQVAAVEAWLQAFLYTPSVGK